MTLDPNKLEEPEELETMTAAEELCAFQAQIASAQCSVEDLRHEMKELRKDLLEFRKYDPQVADSINQYCGAGQKIAEAKYPEEESAAE